MELNCISVQQCHMIVLLGMDSKQEIGYTNCFLPNYYPSFIIIKPLV